MNEEIQDRSPRSPRYSLEDAISDLRKLHGQISKSTVKPETAVAALGYGGMNGAASGALGTLSQYGLINRAKNTVCVTPLGVRIIHPMDEKQREAAIREAALTPKVFSEVYRNMNDCAEQVLSSHFVQIGFNPEAAKRAASVYTKNKSFANLVTGDSIGPDGQKESGTEETKKSTETEIPRFQPPVAPDSAKVPPKERTVNVAELPVPIGDGLVARIPFPISEDDFELLIGTLNLWKKRITQPVAKHPQESFPFFAMWKNKDSDKMVKIVGFMGERDGKKYYQSEDGTGIPEPELFPDKK